MGNLFRFIEPVLLLMLRDKARSYGYELSEHLDEYALTDAQIEPAALYWTLRTLEENGHVTSSWDTENPGQHGEYIRSQSRESCTCRNGPKSWLSWQVP
jgi:DNA-binding PadR family transcriptional regulator